MASFAQIVAESYFSEALVRWDLISQTHTVAKFEANSVSVQAHFEQRENDGPWNVSFKTIQGKQSDLTNSAFRIFNGVFQAVREFIEVRQPDLVVFASKDADLADVYRTYLRREQRFIENLGYPVELPQSVEPYTEFSIRRVRLSNWRQ